MQHAPPTQLDCDPCALVRVLARMAAAGLPAIAAGIAGRLPGVPVHAQAGCHDQALRQLLD